MTKIIALYLPQFHPIKENDEWWGDGFTEWVNVAKARPRFPGHQQPNIPGELGFYDLRIPEVREHQVKLAKEAEVTGFMYWHYWYGGKELLERPFKEVVESGKPDFPFCLGWANHSWYKKNWSSDKGKDKLLIEQTYPGEQDHIDHFYSLLSAFKDKRYIKVSGKLLFHIYLPSDIPNVEGFLKLWRRLAKENNISDFYFIGQNNTVESEEILQLGFDATYDARLMRVHDDNFILWKMIKRLIANIFRCGVLYKYSNAMKHFNNEENKLNDRIAGLYTNYDHSPRSRHRGYILYGYKPKLFYKHVLDTLNLIKSKKEENKILLLQSWNEWGEGNYLEPDRKWGKQFIHAMRDAINDFNNQ